LGLEDVRSLIGVASTNLPKGAFDGGTKAYTIYDNEQLTRADQYNDVVLAYRNGSPIRIRDVGQAVEGPENLRYTAFQGNGKRGIELVISKTPDANVVETALRVDRELMELLRLLPPSVHMFRIIDRTQTIRASVDDVQITLMITVVLVVGVICIFLRNLWATIIPAVAIPMSLIGTFAVMYLLGYSIDNLSLMALTISVGFVVDDAIVMLENIYRHLEAGMNPLEAAIQGAREINFTIISMSLSLIAVFIPLLLMTGIIGRLFREFAVTVSITIIISAIVSLTMSPMMCARFLRREHGVHGRVYLAIERGFNALFAFYERSLDLALRRQRETFAVFLVTVAVAIGLYVVVPKGFFPQQDIGMLNATVEAAQDTSFSEMFRLHRAAVAIIARDPDVAQVGGLIGGNGRSGNTSVMIIGLKPYAERHSSADDIINRLRPQLARLQGERVYLQAPQDITVGARFARTQYQYTLQDADLNELYTWAPKILANLQAVPGIEDVATDQQRSATTATLTIDRDQAARFGIQPELINDTLYDAFGQRFVAQYFTEVNTYNVVLEVRPDMQGDMHALDSIYLKSPLTNQQVPLSAFVTVDTKPVSSLSINHQGQFPAITLSFNLAAGNALGNAVEAIEKANSTMGVPPTLHGTFQGNAQAFQSSLATQPYLIAAAIVAVYVILGILYESFIYPLAILSTLPSAGVGALLTLILFHYDLSVVALVGVILLIGIVKKNGIMMVDFAISAQRNDGRPALAAIRQACLLRFRPIMMTSAAALLGGLPLMLNHGAGSEIRRPLGFAMVGGLLFSQILTLYTTPVVFLYLERLRARLSKRKFEIVSASSITSASSSRALSDG